MRVSKGCLRYGAPGEIRTPDLQLRRLPLYPAELRARDLSVHRRFRAINFRESYWTAKQQPTVQRTSGARARLVRRWADLLSDELRSR